jgi:peptidoglycan hydrolase-like protein with peptidoglycan-binding domain
MKLIGKVGARLLGVVVAAVLGSTLAAPAATAAVRSCSSSTPVASRPALAIGDTGSCVSEAQRRLLAHGFKLGTYTAPTGNYGTLTRDAVSRFQNSRGLARTGTVNAATWTWLAGPLYNKSKCGNVGNKVFLVFDDYPLSLTLWKQLIDTAKANNIGIGLAPNGQYVQSGRADVTYARNKGMMVIDHTYDHKNLTTLAYGSTTAVYTIVWEITRSYIGSNFVRPPYGAYNANVTKALEAQGKNNCLWTLDPRDWDGKTAQAAADYIIRNAVRGTTAVVHLNYLGRVPSLLPYIKKGLAARGLAMCPTWATATPKNLPLNYCR